jgi:hypothetical protein
MQQGRIAFAQTKKQTTRRCKEEMNNEYETGQAESRNFHTRRSAT